MGKKSRKKVGKKEHQERMKARAEKREEQLIQAEEEYEADQDKLPIYGGKPREFIDGDYVRYYGGKDGAVRRGVISDYFKDGKKIEDYFTFKAYDSDVSECVSVNDIYTDIGGMELRFKVGMKIACRSEDAYNQWIPCVIKELWPRPPEGVSNRSVEENAYPMYLCQSHFVKDYQMMIYNDTDDYIREVPGLPRLQIGDEVVFNSALAESIKNSYRHFNGGWMNGKIVDINPRDELWMKDKRSITYVGRYKCSFRHKGKVHNCYILEDNDEYISQSESDPRTRLFDAIEQGCSYDHVCYLVDEFGIDVSVFQDLFISKTLEHASYDALWWAQENLTMPNLSQMHGYEKDVDLMRQKLGESPNVLRFMQKAVDVENDNRDSDNCDGEGKKGLKDVPALCGRWTTKGEIPAFLKGILLRGNILIFDFAISAIGLGSVYSFFSMCLKDKRKIIDLFEGKFEGLDQIKMKFIVEKFSDLKYQCSNDFSRYHSKAEKEDFLSSFKGKDGVRQVKLRLRFEWDFILRKMAFGDNRQNKDENRITMEILHLAMNGEYEVFRAIIEEDENLLYSECELHYVIRGEDNDEFLQEELRNKNFTEGYYKERTRCSLGLTDLLVCGDFEEEYLEKKKFYCYDNLLRKFLRTGNNMADEWVPAMKAEVRKLEEEREEGCLYTPDPKVISLRIQQCEDDETLQGRLQILEFLTTEKHFEAPSPIVAIFSRQCGILRWLKFRGYLTDKQFCLEDLNKYLSYFGEAEWLVDLRLDEAQTLQQYYFCLCIATVHYDDFQSLVWLIREFGVKKLQLDKERALNILHLAAYFGRKEITYYLRTLDTWQLWLNQPIKIGKFKGMYTAHVAVSEGHLDLVELFIKDGCPQVDLNKKSVHLYASLSKLNFVVEWSKNNEEPLQLDANAKQFLQLLQSPDRDIDCLKIEFAKSDCMNPKTWFSCDRAESFRKHIGYICRAASVEFSIWVCIRIMLAIEESFSFNYYEAMIENRPPKTRGRLRIDDEDKQISTWMKNKWVKEEELQCVNHMACTDGLYDPCNIFEFVYFSDLKRNIGRSLMRIERIHQIYSQSLEEFGRHVFIFNNVNEFITLVSIIIQIRDRLCFEDHTFKPFPYDPITVGRKIKLDSKLRFKESLPKDHHNYESVLKKSFLGFSFGTGYYVNLYAMLCFYSDPAVLRYCLQNKSQISTALEIKMMYIASTMNRKDTVEIFLENDRSIEYSLSLRDRFWIAALGAAEKGDFQEMKLYLKESHHPLDPILTHFAEILEDCSKFESIDFDRLDQLDLSDSQLFHGSSTKNHLASLSLFLVYGFLNHSYSQTSSKVNEFLDVAKMYKYERRHLLLVAFCCLDKICYYKDKLQLLWSGFIKLVKAFPTDDYGKAESHIIEKLSFNLLRSFYTGDDTNIIRQCLELALASGANITNGKAFESGYNMCGEAKYILEEFRERQKNIFKQFDVLKKGSKLSKVKSDLDFGLIDPSATDEGGMYLVHIAAAYDRVDILEYIAKHCGQNSLKKVDKEGRSILQIAASAKAVQATTWIKQRFAAETISVFMKSRFDVWKAQLYLKTCIQGFQKLQAVIKGYLVRREMKSRLIIHVENSRRFKMIWTHALILCEELSRRELQTWNSIRINSVDYTRASNLDDDLQEDVVDTMKKLDIAMTAVLDEDNEEDNNTVPDNENEGLIRDISEQVAESERIESTEMYINVRYTSHVAKWLKQGDRKYRDFFVRRITQLSKGERSRILAKRLTGSKMTIFETYLEQKSGFRILWTEEGNNILVWYVAKHDQVSRLMSLIDASQSRSERQLVSAKTLLEEESVLEEESASKMEKIVLDPLSNVPLKVYEIPVNEIAAIKDDDWAPNLRLTDEERAVVETKGTILLLGRSGTGKTVCICNRLDYDRRKNSLDSSSFTQLFVSRSQKLCKYVSETIGASNNTTFNTFDDLLSTLSKQLPKVTNIRDTYHNFNYMSFDRFKAEVYDGGEGSIDPLLVWTCIKSYIKGSIEAVIKNVTQKALGKEEFLSLGSKRCRLTQEQRLEVYSIYQKYEQYMTNSFLWDDCDRIISILERLEVCKNTNRDQYESLRYSKIYIDEIQDYTQAEILLFFYLSGPGDLFLAGDSAQSVVEGVEFRFEDIRSVEYYIAPEKNNLMLQKPMVVNVNFRSHTGVLNIAASILSYMFEAFPNSAKQLKEDRGIFQGPRPSVLYRVDYKSLRSLLKKSLNGAIVLVNDSNISRYRRLLDDYSLIYGIRAAKGLEFKSVIILNFFGDLKSDLQKPWRELLLGRVKEDFRECFPEVEGQLKLLYTGVTRCIDRLFFVETSGSIAGDACVRWLTTTSIQIQKKHTFSLATLDNNIDEVEGVTMTKDDWISSGIENAEAAEDCQKANLASAESLLEKAVYCFQQAGEENLARKARAHRASIQFKSKLLAQKLATQRSMDSNEMEESLSAMEVEAADIVEDLMKENLFMEAEDICCCIMPYLPEYTKKQLEVQIINKLRLFG